MLSIEPDFLPSASRRLAEKAYARTYRKDEKKHFVREGGRRLHDALTWVACLLADHQGKDTLSFTINIKDEKLVLQLVSQIIAYKIGSLPSELAELGYLENQHLQQTQMIIDLVSLKSYCGAGTIQVELSLKNSQKTKEIVEIYTEGKFDDPDLTEEKMKDDCFCMMTAHTLDGFAVVRRLKSFDRNINEEYERKKKSFIGNLEDNLTLAAFVAVCTYETEE